MLSAEKLMVKGCQMDFKHFSNNYVMKEKQMFAPTLMVSINV